MLTDEQRARIHKAFDNPDITKAGYLRTARTKFTHTPTLAASYHSAAAGDSPREKIAGDYFGAISGKMTPSEIASRVQAHRDFEDHVYSRGSGKHGIAHRSVSNWLSAKVAEASAIRNSEADTKQAQNYKHLHELWHKHMPDKG